MRRITGAGAVLAAVACLAGCGGSGTAAGPAAVVSAGQLRASVAGRCSDSSDGMRAGNRRILAASVPRWW